MEENCIFCKIINKEIPSFKIYEDKDVYAFLDINPVNLGHIVIVPKKHSKNLLEASLDDVQAIMNAVKKISDILIENGAQGINIVSNINEVAGQSVFHTHVHIIPRYKDDYKTLGDALKTTKTFSNDEMLHIQDMLIKSL